MVDFDVGELGNQLTQDQIPDNVSGLFEYLDPENLQKKSQIAKEEAQQKVFEPKFKSRKSKPSMESNSKPDVEMTTKTEVLSGSKPEESKIEG